LQKEYITEAGVGRFNCTKFTLSNGTEITLSLEEQEELFNEFIDTLETNNPYKVIGGLTTKLESSKTELDEFKELASALKKLVGKG
jgi:uncharacterized protein YggL (DUF469 family)